MKIRLTILTENDKPRRPEHTEEAVAKAWEFVLNLFSDFSEDNEKATVEKVEFVEDMADGEG